MFSINKEIKEKFLKIVGKDGLLSKDDEMENYSHDESEDLRFFPSIVLLPESIDEISEILKIANEYEIPVTPRGGGTGLSGGALPIDGGIILSLEKMDKIIEIDEDNFFVRCEAGVIVENLQNEVEKSGLFYPPDPASRGTCMIGGNIMENSGGPRAAKYGVTANYLLGLKGVLADGTKFSWGGGVIKNVAGYNLPGLFLGSEGTLGVITEVVLKLITKPSHRKMILAPFSTLESGIKAVAAIYKAGANPSVLEFLEERSIRVSEEYIGEKWPVPSGNNGLLIEVDGSNEDIVDMEIELIYGVLEEFQCEDAVIAEDSKKMDKLWRLRRSVGEAVKSIAVYKEEDTVVPRAKLPLLYKKIRELENKYGIMAISYGHAGDGNIHVNILKKGVSDGNWKEKLPLFIEELFKFVVELGGSITGEHGVGYTQKEYLPIGLDKNTLDLMKSIKKSLDPKGILNPKKIFI